MRLRTTATAIALTLSMGIAATGAAAEPASHVAPPGTPTTPESASHAAPFDIAKGKSIFGGASLAKAVAQQASPATTNPNEHQFGVGVRLGGIGSGVAGAVRYFFYGGPLGVQAEVSVSGLSLGSVDWRTVQFSPSVLYRFVERHFDAPISLTPYAGAGLSFIHNNFGDNEDFFDSLGVDSTDIGVLLFGGVEIFFDRVPNLGVSGELTYISNEDIGSRSFGGARFTAAAHWYFW